MSLYFLDSYTDPRSKYRVVCHSVSLKFFIFSSVPTLQDIHLNIRGSEGRGQSPSGISNAQLSISLQDGRKRFRGITRESDVLQA